MVFFLLQVSTVTFERKSAAPTLEIISSDEEEEENEKEKEKRGEEEEEEFHKVKKQKKKKRKEAKNENFITKKKIEKKYTI